MKATLEFTLPEEESEFLSATHGADWQGVAWDLEQWLREGDKYKEAEEVPWREVRARLYDIMQERGVEF